MLPNKARGVRRVDDRRVLNPDRVIVDVYCCDFTSQSQRHP
jgi:hypothetical protein